MEYVLVPSYKSLFFALYLKTKGRPVTVISNNASIRDFCGKKGISCFFFENRPIGPKTLNNIISLRETAKEIVKNVGEGNDIYLLLRIIDVDCIYIAKELSKRNRIHYADIYSDLRIVFGTRRNSLFDLEYYKALFINLVLKATLLMNLTIEDYNPWWVQAISEHALDKMGVLRLNFEKDYEEIIIETSQAFSEEAERCCILMLVDTPKIDKIIKYSDLEAVYRVVLGHCNDICIKDHPMASSTAMSDITGLPSRRYETTTPVEILLPNVSNCLIAFFSASLITASKVGHLKVISLLELVKWRDRELKSRYHEWLHDCSGGKILFPNNVSELLDMIG